MLHKLIARLSDPGRVVLSAIWNTIDHACLDLLTNWSEQHESKGGRVEIDWDSLSDKYQNFSA